MTDPRNADRVEDAEVRLLREIFSRPVNDGAHSRCCAKCSRRPWNTVDCGYNWACPKGCHR